MYYQNMEVLMKKILLLISSSLLALSCSHMESTKNETFNAKTFAEQVYFKGEEVSQNSTYDGAFGNWIVSTDEQRSPSSNNQQQNNKKKPASKQGTKPKEFLTDIERCANRIQLACNNLSGNNESRIEENAESCKSIQNPKTGSIIEVLQLKQADKIILVKTQGAGITNGQCSMVKYTLDPSGIKKIVGSGDMIFLLSNDGQVYYMFENNFYEILNSSRLSYTNTINIRGNENNGVILEFPGGTSFPFTRDTLVRRINQDSVRRINFRIVTQERSIFRDE